MRKMTNIPGISMICTEEARDADPNPSAGGLRGATLAPATLKRKMRTVIPMRGRGIP
jgi:hypothetical protein